MPEGGDPAEAVETLDASGERGTTKLDTSGWDPGAYDAVLTDGEDAEVARVTFYLRDPQAQLQLSTDRRTYERGQPIEVSWSRAPPTAGTGSASTRPRRRTPRRTTT